MELDKDLRAIVSFYGYGDILGQWYAEPSEFYCQRPTIHPTDAYKFIGRSEISDGPWSRFNFYLFYPPTLFLHGDKDTDVPYEQSILMYEKLENIGVNTELITIYDGDHVFDKNFNDPKVQNAFKRVIEFLQRYLSK